MREKHPIDEQFRSVLHDAEATPPEAVRTALAGHFGWSGTSGKGAGVGPMFALIIGLIGVGTAIWSWQDPDGNGIGTGIEATAAHSVPAMISYDHAPLAEPATIALADAHIVSVDAKTPSTTHPDQQAGTSATAAVRSASSDAIDAVRTGSHSAAPKKKLSAVVAQRNTTTTGTDRPSVPSESRPDQAGQPLSAMPVVGRSVDASASQEALLAANVILSDIQATSMTPLAIRLDENTERTLSRGRPVVDYVVANGSWWAGPYVGVGRVQGQWRGAEADALDRAEEWRSTAQAGILVGRAWRSGWAVSTGLGLARVRSVFRYDQSGALLPFTDVDTTWSQSVHNPSGTTLYTWSIDTLSGTTPGPVERLDARNLYTAVQVPIQLHWNRNFRRFQCGAFAGLALWVPTQRRGLTLVPSAQDGSPTTVPLSDRSVETRFAAQVHGQAGLSLGFAFTEHTGVFVEPMISTPVVAFDRATSAAFTRPLLQLRLQHEFPAKRH